MLARTARSPGVNETACSASRRAGGSGVAVGGGVVAVGAAVAVGVATAVGSGGSVGRDNGVAERLPTCGRLVGWAVIGGAASATGGSVWAGLPGFRTLKPNSNVSSSSAALVSIRKT